MVKTELFLPEPVKVTDWSVKKYVTEYFYIYQFVSFVQKEFYVTLLGLFVQLGSLNEAWFIKLYNQSSRLLLVLLLINTYN